MGLRYLKPFSQERDIMSTQNETLTKSGKPRKQRQIGTDGKPLHRLVLVVTETDYKLILEAVSEYSGSDFAKHFIFESNTEVKQKFLGTTISAICEKWNNLEEAPV